MSNEIETAMQATKYHDACDDCGKRTDGLMTCYYSHDDSTTKLCPACIKDGGFCLRCGNYSAGISSFDFSDMPVTALIVGTKSKLNLMMKIGMRIYH